MFDIENIVFRANPAANLENAMRYEDRETKGTVQTDTGTADVTGASIVSGIRYTGKDGEEKFISFFHEDQLTQDRIPHSISAQEDPLAIQRAIHKIIKLHEVDSIVSVTKAGNVLTISHTGPGTLRTVVIDGADVVLTRADAVVAAAVAPADLGPTTARTAGARPVEPSTPEGGEANDAPADDVDATDAAKAAAKELDVDLTKVEGHGVKGNIIKADVEAAAKSAAEGSGDSGEGKPKE